MKQILQHLNDGKTVVEEVPVPRVRRGAALVRTAVSLVSAGTERMVVGFAEKNLVGKAASRPDLVKQVLSKARREGILPTIEASLNKLDQPMPLGYSSAGTIVEVSPDLADFKPGDRVACAGGGYAVHAEYGVIPKNLMVHLPDNVDFESAAFTTLGAIALHGFRLSAPQVGESVCVIGLGLLGLLTAQIARAAGCQVFGTDLAGDRVALAHNMGFNAANRESCLAHASGLTSGRGFDHVLICADTTSDDPVELAGQLARDRGSVVAVGAVGLNIPRKIYYEKEIQFKVSRSYGPGRYDPRYEEEGVDYPIGYVRWTENRNLQAFVDLLASGKIDVRPLITHRFAISDAPQAYELILGKTHKPFLGVLLTYPETADESNMTRKIAAPGAVGTARQSVRVGVLGAGNYAQAVFLPAMRKTGQAELVGIATASGLSAQHTARRYGFRYASTSDEEVLSDPDINCVAILTRHQHHSRQVVTALEHQKAVYCEKPLAINQEELDTIKATIAKQDGAVLTVGFNRRFAPMAQQMREFYASRSEPMLVQYRVNAGYLPLTHWLHDPQQGGGRIIGEACHFIDFLTFLTGQPPAAVSVTGLADADKYNQDNVLLTFRFPDSSIGTIAYLANGNRNLGKERVEVFCAGKTAILDDFRTLELTSDSGRKLVRSPLGQDKGHQKAWANFIRLLLQGGELPIPYEHLFKITEASFAALEALRTHTEITL